MSWTAKPRPASPATRVSGPLAKPTPASPVAAPRNVRVSNALKDFLWTLNDVEHGRVLDLGPVWHSTVTFFVEHGFRVSTEDLLRSWKEFLSGEVEHFQHSPAAENEEILDAPALAERFLETALVYPPDSFHAVLAWDLFDYLDADLMTRVVARLNELLRPGGSVLAIFHSRAPERFHRYRIVEDQALELLPANAPATHQRIFQNRGIMDLFGGFHSSKTYVGRDQLREGLFIK